MGNGLVRLVGSKPSELQMAETLRIAKLQTVTGDLTFTVNPEGRIKVSCLLGSNSSVSGTFGPPVSLRNILKASYATRCCPDFISDSFVKIRSGGIWYGFSSLLDHLRRVHGLREGNKFEFSLDDSTLWVTHVSTDETFANYEIKTTFNS